MEKTTDFSETNLGFTEDGDEGKATLALHELFSRQAAAFPENIAVEYKGAQISYGNLNTKSSQFARVLQRRYGVSPKGEDVVAILLPRCPELYLTMIACMKAGGAYVAVDPQHQKSRLEFVLRDTNAVVLVTTREIQKEIADVNLSGTDVLDIESSSMKKEISNHPKEDLVDVLVPDSNLCYIIYTSGSTGNPKGVEIEHRTVVNFIRGELEIFPVTSEDRVLQGFSPSFDASVEEIWLAFSTGGTLVAAPPELMQSGPDLPYNLHNLNIAVFSTVPTLLRTLNVANVNLPTLKLLILGGEACGEDLIPWSEGRILANTYGPTEATVVATVSLVKPNKKITIGKPLKNYRAFLLDQNLEEVEQGKEGELCLGGKCLARGYRNLPEKTRQSFIEHPIFEKIYRTGDLVRLTSDGEIDYLGRIDDQVKIRGFRVEIGSIETHLQKQDNVKIAAVVVVSPAPGQQNVIAHLTLENPAEEFKTQQVVTNMRKALPEYMIPNGYVIHEVLPTLASGKTDKKKLKALKVDPSPFRASENYIAPRTGSEKIICKVWEQKLGHSKISVADDFFALGGQSVVAAMVVSELRKLGIELSVRDLYTNPTIEGLAGFLNEKSLSDSKNEVSVHIPDNEVEGNPRYFLCAILQALWIILTSGSLTVLVFYLVLTMIRFSESIYEYYGVQGVVLLFLVLLVCSMPIYVLMTVLFVLIVKMVFLRSVKPGKYALWSMFYVRWWIVNQTKNWAPVSLLSGTPMMNTYARLMGAQIGRGVYYGSTITGDFHLISIGDGTTIEPEVVMTTHRVDRGTLFLGRITIEENCSIGARAVVSFNTTIKRNSRIEALSLVSDNTVIEANSYAQGSPAVASCKPMKNDGDSTWGWAKWIPVAQCGCWLLFAVIYALPFLCVSLVIAGIPYFSRAFQSKNWPVISLMVLPAGVFLQVGKLLLSAVTKWFLVGKIKQGNYSINSWAYIKYWIMERIIMFTLSNTQELFATLYTNIWLKSLGMSVGRQAEVSTAINYMPDLVTLGEGAFIADYVSLNGPTFYKGKFALTKTRVGAKTFLGNNCVNMPHSVIGSDSLVGVLSSTPDVVPHGTSYLGSPPFLLPARASSKQTHSCARTFNPPLYLYISRLIWEGIKIILPPVLMLYSLLGYWILVEEVSYELWGDIPLLFWSSSVFWSWAIIVCNFAFVWSSKWLLIGRFRPSEHPLWSSFVWRAELVASLEENVAMPLGLQSTLGTPFLCWWYRALGAKIGSRVYLASIYLTEADLIEIGDESCIDEGTTIQSHLFEDRIMKMDKLYIGNECTVCADAVVLYGARVEDRCTIMPLSLCMKSETLESNAVYCGIPAQKVIAELHNGYYIDWELTSMLRKKLIPSNIDKNVKITKWRSLDTL